ncbi:NAD(P)H-dependent oxidoreductase [Bombilactobacillus bombi]|uniref:NAD(P)H-dependent oxidoreductase n=1 Tax=Bombilactobacillus bombi TaxID=1303590 RepID=UPI0015E601A8|nr:NAD(P)H-dependent oxidoreductase [Bombilactobacillus bombi]MBA1434777.1 flavodoxin family protein [Bombilactobacillus bombi]
MLQNNILIIYCHPYAHSFNHAELAAVQHNLHQHRQEYTLIDLYADKFTPVYDQEELRLFHTGQTHDPLVTKYLDLLRNCQGIVFITPIWWNEIPGMLKGFIDKVMKEGPGLSHTVTKTGIKGELTNIKKAYVLTTSTSPTFYLRLFAGNALQKIFINKTLRQIGIKKAQWQNFGHIGDSSLKRRKKYLRQLLQQPFVF